MKRTLGHKLFPTSILRNKELLKLHKKELKAFNNSDDYYDMMGEERVAEEYYIMTGRDLMADTMIGALYSTVLGLIVILSGVFIVYLIT